MTRDPKDNAIVACAKQGEADYIADDDQDLLDLGECETIQVVAARPFIEILEERQRRRAK